MYNFIQRVEKVFIDTYNVASSALAEYLVSLPAKEKEPVFERFQKICAGTVSPDISKDEHTVLYDERTPEDLKKARKIYHDIHQKVVAAVPSYISGDLADLLVHEVMKELNTHRYEKAS
jgi:hypothetical protein